MLFRSSSSTKLARTVGQALWSPTTASADPMAVITALAAQVRDRGAHIVCDSRIVSAGPGWLESSATGRSSVGHTINAAGLHADTVAHWFGVGAEYRMLPFKGNYLLGTWSPGRLRRHVYPVPDPRNPFLGVHLTVRLDGRVKLGPTAWPAAGRTAYRGLKSTSWGEMRSVLTLLPRFALSRHHDVVATLAAEVPRHWRCRLVSEGADLVPSLRAADFRAWGRPGIRAQLFDTQAGRLEMDFVVRSGPSSTHVLNAVSPGWTASFAMADHIGERALEGVIDTTSRVDP